MILTTKFQSSCCKSSAAIVSDESFEDVSDLLLLAAGKL